MSSKDLNDKFSVKAFGVRDNLVTRGKLSTNDNRGGRRRPKSSMSNYGNTSSIRCYQCKKEGYTKRIYLERINKVKNLDRSFGSSKWYNGASMFSEATLMEDGYESSKVFVVSSNSNDYG